MKKIHALLIVTIKTILWIVHLELFIPIAPMIVAIIPGFMAFHDVAHQWIYTQIICMLIAIPFLWAEVQWISESEDLKGIAMYKRQDLGKWFLRIGALLLAASVVTLTHGNVLPTLTAIALMIAGKEIRDLPSSWRRLPQEWTASEPE